MNLIHRNDIQPIPLPGRVLQKAVGRDSASTSARITMGFAHYSAASGPMEPHQHAEEVVFIINADHGYVRLGPDQEHLGERIPLQAGDSLHFPVLEWHVFEYDEGGWIDGIFIYGQVDHIRPEEISH